MLNIWIVFLLHLPLQRIKTKNTMKMKTLAEMCKEIELSPSGGQQQGKTRYDLLLYSLQNQKSMLVATKTPEKFIKGFKAATGFDIELVKKYEDIGDVFYLPKFKSTEAQ